MGRIVGLVIKPIENGNGGTIDNSVIDIQTLTGKTIIDNNTIAVTDNTTKKVRRSTR